jgi:phage virion morphogenesis protein
MGAAVEIDTKEIKDLVKKINAYALNSPQKTQLLKSLGKKVEEQTKDRFDTETDPKGDPWKALTEKYAKQKAKKSSGGILDKTGLMRISIEFQLLGDYAVLIGSPMEYADCHQSAKKESRRRRFLGLSVDNIAELEAVVDEFMKGQMS